VGQTKARPPGTRSGFLWQHPARQSEMYALIDKSENHMIIKGRSRREHKTGAIDTGHLEVRHHDSPLTGNNFVINLIYGIMN